MRCANCQAKLFATADAYRPKLGHKGCTHCNPLAPPDDQHTGTDAKHNEANGLRIERDALKAELRSSQLGRHIDRYGANEQTDHLRSLETEVARLRKVGLQLASEEDLDNPGTIGLLRDNTKLRELLKHASCPDPNCKDGAIPHGHDPDGNWQAEQCQFCYERARMVE